MPPADPITAAARLGYSQDRLAAPGFCPHGDMPPLERDGNCYSFFEFWRPLYFYLPIWAYAIWLSLRYGGATLPTIANPKLHLGGLVGESKRETLALLGPRGKAHLAPYIAFTRSGTPHSSQEDTDQALGRMADAGLGFPLVAKPDLGCRGIGVKLICGPEDLAEYIASFPMGLTLILQELVTAEGEAGVFYVRLPGEPRGKIFSLTLKYSAYVKGDGRRRLRDLILDDPRAARISAIYFKRHAAQLDSVVPKDVAFRLSFTRNHCRGAIFRDGNGYITQRMTEAFEAIAREIPEFYFGRFDVRFDSLAALQRGEDYSIVEFNGAGSEALHIWDGQTPLWRAYRDLLRQYALLYKIGYVNKKRGYKPAPLREVFRLYRELLQLDSEMPLTD